MKTAITHKLSGVIGAITMSVLLASIMVIGLHAEYHSNFGKIIRGIFEVWLYPVSFLLDFTLPLIGYKNPDPYSVPLFIIMFWFIYTACAGFAAGWCLSRGWSRPELIKK